MFEQINSHVLSMSKNLTDATFKAHHMAMAGFERIADIQLKMLENRMNATTEFMTEASELRDFNMAAKTMWPKSMQLMKESAEKMYSSSQEVMGVTMKTTEAMTDVVKGSFEAANETLAKNVNMAAKKAAVK